MADPGVEQLARWACSDCSEHVTAADPAWVERVRVTHRCPSPERQRVADRITMALKGLWDG